MMKIKEDREKWKDICFHKISTNQSDLHIQCNPNEKFNGSLYKSRGKKSKNSYGTNEKQKSQSDIDHFDLEQ